MNPSQNSTPLPPPAHPPIQPAPTPGGSQSTPPKLRILTLKQKIKLIAAVVLLVAALGLWISGNIANSNAENDLKDNGVRVTGVSDGEYHEREARQRRGTTMVYKAWYEYTREDGVKSRAIGEKKYSSPDDIKAGVKVDIYYDPNDASKGTYVENEPEGK